MSRKIKNKAEMPAKVKKGFRAYAALVMTLALVLGCSVNAFAAGDDPINVVNNLSDFIFGLIRAVGLIILGWASFRWACPSRVTILPSVPTAS